MLFLDRGAEGPRTIENANETLAALQTLPGFRVAMVRMEHLSLRDQWSLHDFHDMARKIACHKSCSGKNRRFLRNVTNVAEFIGILRNSIMFVETTVLVAFFLQIFNRTL